MEFILVHCVCAVNKPLSDVNAGATIESRGEGCHNDAVSRWSRLVGKVMRLIVSVRPSVSPVAFEPTELLP